MRMKRRRKSKRKRRRMKSLLSAAKRPHTYHRPVIFGRAPVYTKQVSDRLFSTAKRPYIHTTQPKVGSLSGSKRPYTYHRPVIFGHAPVYMPTGRRAVYFRAQSARIHAHLPLYNRARSVRIILPTALFSGGLLSD